MADEVKASRRAYHSPLRADQAQQTRRRILESARRLFSDRGYAGTTVAAIAEDAAVSPETIYLSLGGKRGLLEGVMDITGPHDSVADDEKWWLMVARQPHAAERLDSMVEYSCRILARTRPIHAIIRGAADKEAFAAALGRRLLTERLTNQTERIRKYLGGALRPGLSMAQAGERYCVLASPELYHLLTVELGWTAEQHRTWLTRLLRTELLGSDGP
ncbi:MAG TPA: helix-turn-helix domain-containing protein [Acidimicrobiales bacterium]|nr:helix-turn-helix domain-containing protein [Acidimicrobiales bacterium]